MYSRTRRPYGRAVPCTEESLVIRRTARAAVIALVAAFATTAAVGAPSAVAKKKCHKSYKGACLKPNASDYDCRGGSGDGPYYTGVVRIVGPDVFRLDADGDGYGCE